MRATRHFAVLLTLLALAAALSACAPAGSAELVSDESPVPDGLPVMYEFFTET
jgi:outer membrane lipoprotein-sorting protein